MIGYPFTFRCGEQKIDLIAAALPHTNEVAVQGVCIFGGGSYTVVVDRDAFERWHRAEYADITRHFPLMEPGDREFLLQGYSPAGWELKFPDTGVDEDTDFGDNEEV